jgi:hypothetical protein
VKTLSEWLARIDLDLEKLLAGMVYMRSLLRDSEAPSEEGSKAPPEGGVEKGK